MEVVKYYKLDSLLQIRDVALNATRERHPAPVKAVAVHKQEERQLNQSLEMHVRSPSLKWYGCGGGKSAEQLFPRTGMNRKRGGSNLATGKTKCPDLVRCVYSSPQLFVPVFRRLMDCDLPLVTDSPAFGRAASPLVPAYWDFKEQRR